MPYIAEKDRPRYEEAIKTLVDLLGEIPEEDRDGHINYCFTVILKRLYAPPKYKRYNKAMGVLSCIAQEFYRRVIAPYEDQKIEQNGDV